MFSGMIDFVPATANRQWRSRASCAAVALATAALVSGLAADPARAQPTETIEEPAFQGHGAEMRMRDETSEARRRALFFDGTALELGPLGLPCDHLVKRKPQATAGIGFVVLLALRSGGPERRARIWVPPGQAATLADARRLADRSVIEKVPDAVLREIDAAEFVWCR